MDCMAQTLSFRQATVADCKEISKLLLRCAERFLLADFSPQGQALLCDSLQATAIADYLHQGLDYRLAFVQHQGQPQLVGVIALKRPCHLYHLFVDPNWHGRGIARQLLAELWPTVQAWAAAAEQSELTVNASLYAAPVYLKWGFVADSPPRDRGGVIDQPMRLQLAHDKRQNQFNNSIRRNPTDENLEPHTTACEI